MAAKRIPPPPSLSSDDEHLTDDELVDESSSDDEQQTPKPEIKKPIQKAQSESESEDEVDGDNDEEEEDQTPAQAKKPMTQKPKESDSDSDSDSEESGKSPHSPSASDFTVKPIASKPMVESIKNKKAEKAKPVVVVAAKPPAKRPIEAEGKSGKDSNRKRVKVNNGDGGENEEKKKKSGGGVNRVWNDDDEIALLQGIIDYRVKKGVDPNADIVAFHEFIKENLHADVTKDQLSNKIKRLKKKYVTIVEKSGEDPVFSKPHDCRSFELLKKIWGKGGSVNGAKSDKKSGSKGNATLAAKLKDEGKALVVKEKVKGKDEVSEGKANMVKEKLKGKDEIKVVNGDFAEMYPYLNSALDLQWEAEPFRALSEESRRLMKESMFRNKKALELEKGFKILAAEEIDVYMKKLELVKETTAISLSALKSGD